MTDITFRKRFRDPQRAASARVHRDWLASLNCGVRLPALVSATRRELEFEHLGDQQPGPDDLGVLAQALGRLHAAAHISQLHAARLARGFHG